MTIGEKIKYYRKRAGLTQKELGSQSNTSERTIQQYEGEKRQPRIEQLRKIASVLNIPMSTFIEEPTKAEALNSVKKWIEDNDEKVRELIKEILKTHSYRVEEKDFHWLIITDYQGFRFRVRRDDFEEMCMRSDRDIVYNIEKLINGAPEYTRKE